jgi:hypothetical protein
MSTISAVHVTHEAVRKVGGIGAVLEGLVNAPAYQAEIQRTLLVGPLFDRATDANLGDGGQVRYSSLTSVDRGDYALRLGPVCETYGVNLIYGTRPLRDEWSDRATEVEVLLVDVADMRSQPINDFKWRLYDRFGIDSMRYEQVWDYEQYVRLAPPAFDAARRLLDLGGDRTAVIIGHEYMGLPTVFRALLAGDPRLAAVFHLHEVAAVRRIVEEHPAHDIMFYNVMPRALERGLHLRQVFGDQMAFYKHGLGAASHHCDGIFAVGELVRRELEFVSADFARRPIELVPNGIPAVWLAPREKEHSRALLLDYAQALLGWRPSFVFSHVARLVMSKAFWRDVHVLDHLDRLLDRQRESAVLFVLSTEGAQRRPDEIRRMESDYGWPVNHRLGYPDLIGSEVGLHRCLQDFSRRSRAVKIVFVNQFGWDRARCGERMPPDMAFADLRKGTDLEFGLSVYEPYGISQLEALTFGALCMPSSVCGCVAFARQQSGGAPPASLLVADYVSAASHVQALEELLNLAREDADQVLAEVSRKMATRAFGLLREHPQRRLQLMEPAYDLAARMSWQVIAADFFLPAVRRSLRCASERCIAAAPEASEIPHR